MGLEDSPTPKMGRELAAACLWELCGLCVCALAGMFPRQTAPSFNFAEEEDFRLYAHALPLLCPTLEKVQHIYAHEKKLRHCEFSSLFLGQFPEGASGGSLPCLCLSVPACFPTHSQPPHSPPHLLPLSLSIFLYPIRKYTFLVSGSQEGETVGEEGLWD